jgi:protein gp37
MVDWVIIGGESGNETGKYRYRPADVAWFYDLIQQCKEANCPVFVKQMGTAIAKEMKYKDRHGGDMNEWPEPLQIRQFPNIDAWNRKA